MEIVDSHLCEVTQTVWTSVLGLVCQRADDVAPIPQDRPLMACVHISSAWEGTVAIESSEGLVRRAASILLGLDRSSASVDELRDTLGELTNIIGGNLKGLLPKPSRLSVPTVFQESEFRLALQGSQPVWAVGFRCEGEPMRVTLLKRQDMT